MSKHRQRRPPSGPQYRFTGQYLKVSFVLAWIVILAIVFGGLFGSEKADRLADIIVPSMVALIVALLGVHRAFGSLDYRAAAKLPAAAEEAEAESGNGYESAYRGRGKA